MCVCRGKGLECNGDIQSPGRGGFPFLVVHKSLEMIYWLINRSIDIPRESLCVVLVTLRTGSGVSKKHAGEWTGETKWS